MWCSINKLILFSKYAHYWLYDGCNVAIIFFFRACYKPVCPWPYCLWILLGVMYRVCIWSLVLPVSLWDLFLRSWKYVLFGTSRWHAVASWTWDAQDETCGICRMAFDGCCPDCKLPGDDCPLSKFFFYISCLLFVLSFYSFRFSGYPLFLAC